MGGKPLNGSGGPPAGHSADSGVRGVASRPAAPALALGGVSKEFGAVRAVDGISLIIQPGEVVALLGPNGAGKTTTIDMILGLQRPTRGTLAVYGLSPHQAVQRGLVAAVMQAGGLLSDLTVRETVEYIAYLFPGHRPIDDVMDRTGLGGVADRPVGKCSGGEQQRLRFAMALLPDPALLILDEPTQGMDVAGRRAFWTAIRDETTRGRTVLFATHYLEEADAYADRIVMLRGGRLVADGTAAVVKSQASGRVIRATWPGASLDALSGVAGVDHVEVQGATVLIRSHDADVVARHLLTRTPAHDLEIRSTGLEEAFLALTGEETAEPALRGGAGE